VSHSTWDAFVSGDDPSGHGAEIYSDVGELAESVATFLAAGFEAGEAGVVVATPEHVAAITDALAARGWSAQAIDASAQLLISDAESTLEAILSDGAPSAEAFERVIGGLVDELAGRPLRIFGEMVDLLSRRGLVDEAVALEELWNGLQLTRHFSLLCGYGLDVFDASVQAGPLPSVCRVHSHVLPAHDDARFRSAVERALVDVLGPTKARDVLYIVGGTLREKRVPVAQDALRWVTANMPAQAERILALARSLYTAAPAHAVSA
jgi:MEDS: MEthanogen/methylotroph, DcmR Sensory domain